MSVKFYLDLYNKDDHCVFISKISKQSAEQNNYFYEIIA